MIQFAENFKNDDSDSIILRYPGSYRSSENVTDNPKAWPIRGSSTLETNIKPFNTEANTRLELILGFSGSNNLGANTTILEFFGIEISSVNVSPVHTITVQNIAVTPITAGDKLHIIIDVEPDGLIMTVLVNDSAEIIKASIEIDNHKFSSVITGYQDTWVLGLPTFIEYCVLAFDTEKGTRLRTPEFVTTNLTVQNAGEWAYSEVGYIEDTNKKDPEITYPNIFTTERESDIVFVPENQTKIYATARTDGFDLLSINSRKYPIGNNNYNTALPVFDSAETISIRSIQGELENCNADGVCFLGEIDGTNGIDFITYDELSTLCDMQSTGTLNNIEGVNKYLHFTIDGKEVIVPKIPVKHSTPWNAIYDKGLVYGTDTIGKVPGSPPVNQHKIITINGDHYIVRLIRGLSSDLSFSASGNNHKVTQNSEFNRLFYSVTNDSRITGYTYDKLAEYSSVDLGFESTNGRYSFMQETAYNTANAFIRGNTGVAYVTTVAKTTSLASYGWRPILVKI